MTTRPPQMDDDQRAAARKIEKLLRLAGGTTSTEERDSALARAQEMMLAYNLDAAAIGASDDGRRADEKLRGGFYEYERDLMARIADVNFCLHWCRREWEPRPVAEQQHTRVQRYQDRWVRENVRRYRHRLVGRRINIMAAEQMYRYVLSTTERLTREFVARGMPTTADGTVVGLAQALRSRRAVSFREGVASAVAQKLWARREDQLAQERAAEAEAEQRAAQARAAGLSSSTAMTVSQLRQSERDENIDFLNGAGWSAKQRAKQEAQARERREAEEAYTRWCAAHPEEAAAQEAERLREEREAERREARNAKRRTGRMRWSSAEDKTDWAAWREGETAGRSVGLEPQTEHSSAPRKIAGRVG